MDLEKKAIERLKVASDMSLRLYKQPLVITYSGGKDSDVLLHLAEVSGIPFEVLHSLTTADAPQTVYHVRDTFHRMEDKGIKCTVDKHVQPGGSRITMWNLIPRKLVPPTRLVRYCCAVLKKGGGKDRFIATGVRWDESVSRAKYRAELEILGSSKSKNMLLSDNDEDRRLFESCQLKGKRIVNPIIDWKTDDVIDYLKVNHIRSNPLYNCGFRRVGCIGCPMAGQKAREFEFSVFPMFKSAYIRSFEKMIENRKQLGKMYNGTRWGSSAVDVFHWWMEDGVLPGQVVFDGFEEI